MKDYVGNSLQIRGAEQYILQNGKGDGMHFLYIRNGLGLEVWISLDRAGDVSRVSFKGDNMGYFAPCGYVAPEYYDGVGAGFLKSFTAGFFTTCGLTAVGSPCTDEGEELPLHGTISHIPAELMCKEENEKELVIKLRITDARIFGRKLVMDRIYRFSYVDNSFEVSDKVTNLADAETPYMILYHCNMGYPLLSQNSIVKIPNNNISARDEHAEKFLDTALDMEKPKANYQERCYYYDVKEKNNIAKVGIYNADINKGVVLSYDKASLPCFTEWKMMGKTDYVLGLEPGNCTPDGRDVLRKKGTLKFLQPDESGITTVRFTFVSDEKDFEGEI
ncbi:MAG: aldose 1-epimerase family protein [Oscillospiraceae bacterium]|nr:aldose 1-epimerase family protein [Oscillospiraceae bacterium]